MILSYVFRPLNFGSKDGCMFKIFLPYSFKNLLEIERDMPGNHYKVFFTISFFYQVDIKKKVSKSFKSD